MTAVAAYSSLIAGRHTIGRSGTSAAALRMVLSNPPSGEPG